jgi:hypothetical protein
MRAHIIDKAFEYNNNKVLRLAIIALYVLCQYLATGTTGLRMSSSSWAVFVIATWAAHNINK